MSETRDDLREALARELWDIKYEDLPDARWESALKVAKDIPDGRSAACVANIRRAADRLLSGPLAQVSALQAEVERLQKVEGEREKGRVPDGTGLSPKGEAPDGSSSQSDFDPSRVEF